MRTGIFGGTFDPPHIAHLVLADEAISELNLDRVLWVLTPEPPHKKQRTITSITNRLQMLSLAIEGNATFGISRVDLDRQPPYYAVDTVRLLKDEFPGDDIVYLLGSDSVRDLPIWHDPKGFVDACDGIGMMYRPGVSLDLDYLDVQLPGFCDKLKVFDTPLLDISSSEIRHLSANDNPFRYFLPASVYQYIREHNLYT
jgi:nicotinate-nucleotide adenylyltransferase